MKIESVKNFLWKYNPVTIPAMVVQNSFVCIPREMKIMNIVASILLASAVTFRPNFREAIHVASYLDNGQIFVISAVVTLATLTLISGIGATLICRNDDFKKQEYRKLLQKGIKIIF